MADRLEKIESGKYLPLMEEFYTIQGEGLHTGKAAYFIRIGGCDVGCQWCDTKRSWNAMNFEPVPADEIIDRISGYPAKSVVVTGGEPLLYNLDYFTSKLNEKGIETYIETSGAYEISGHWDWICLSPKKSGPPLKDIFKVVDELKVIIQREDDLNWAEENARKVSDGCYLFLQPEWSVAPKILPVIIDYAKSHPKWRISLQSHKYMKIP